MNDNDDRRWLYERMQKAGVNTGNYDEFTASLNNKEDRDWYYQKSIDLGLDVGSADDFAGMMVSAPTRQPTQPQQPTAPVAPAGDNGSQYSMAQPNAPHYDFGGELPSVRPPKAARGENKAAGENVQQKPKNEPRQPEQGQESRQSQQPTQQQEPTGEGAPLGPERFAKLMEVGAAAQQFSQRMENIRKGNEPFGSHKGVQYNPTTGKFEDVYYTTSGDAVATPLEQSRINRENYKHTEMALEERTNNAMGKIDPDNVAEQVWQRAEERTRAEQSKHNRSIWDGMTMPSVMGGNTGFAKAGQTVYSNMVDHLKYHDIKKMADEAWQSLGSEKQTALINEIYSALLNRYPGAPDEELMPLAREMARQQSDKRMFELAVEKNAPKSATDYFFRNVYQSNAIMKIAEAAARKTAGTTGDWAARDVAENQYREDGHKFVGFLGTAAGMALDPVMWLSGGVSGAATKGTMWLGGKIASKAAMRKAVERGVSEAVLNRFAQAVGRRFSTTIGGRALQGAVGGASNFATFESANEALEQMRMGGKVEGVGEDDQYIVGDYNVGDIFKQMGHGALMGSTIGALGPLTGNVSDRLVGSIGSTAGKAGVRAGQLVVGKVAEGTIFSIPEWIEGERDAFDVWTDNMAMMLAFGIQGAVKSAPRRIAELSKQPGSKAGFETRLRSVLNGRGDLALTKDERDELQRGGYSDLNTLVEEYELYQNPGDRSAARPESEVRRQTAGDGAELPYNRFVELMNDSNISEAARAKMYYYITGQQLPMSTVMGSTIIEYTDENGNVTGYTVRSVGANGVITSRNFDSKERADVEVEAINRQAELNSVDIGERHYDSQSEQKRMMEACEAIGREKGAPAQSLYDMMQRNPDEMSEVELQWAQDIMKAYDELGGKYSSELLRAEIGSQFDVDVDKAIGKEPNRRSEAEQKAVEEYMNRLWEGVRPKEDEPTEAQRGYEANTDERKLIAAGVAMGDERGQEAWDGVRQRIEDDAEMQVAEWREEGKKAMHRDGSLRSATLKEKDEDGNDKTVYIVDGNVAMMADGTMVDPEASDRSVAIYDPIEDRKRIINPTSDMGVLSLGVVMSAEEFESDLQRRKQAYIQQQLDDASGKVTVQVGEQVQVPGTDAMGTVVAVSEDGEGMTVQLEDGTQVPVVRADLQQVADEAAMADYQARHGNENQNENENDNENVEQPGAATPMVEGAPVEFTPGMEITVIDDDGNEQAATVLGRVRSENFQYVPDEEGNIIEYKVDGQVKHDNIDQLAQRVVSHVEPVEQPTEEAAMPTDEVQQPTIAQQPSTAIAEEEQPTVEPMPMREDGEADFMSTTPERGHQFIYNESGLSREEAGQFVKANIDAAEKELTKLKGKAPKMGTSISKYQQQKAEHQQQIDDAQRVVDYWNGVKAVQNSILTAEAAERAERDRAAHDAAVLAEQQRQAEELAKQQGGSVEVPDMSVDKASDARARGYRMKDGNRYDRQGKVQGVEGKEVEVDFTTSEKPTIARYKVVEADGVQPSHIGGQRNPLHFISEAQPKERTDDVSDVESGRIAANMSPERITASTNAYGGAPVVNARGEVIQGNNRAIALRKMAGYPESAARYKQYLIDHAGEFGLDAEAVSKMRQPVLVREAGVTDEEAIRLGQFKASDLETGGVVRIDAAPTLAKMDSDQVVRAMGILFDSGVENEGMTIGQLIDNNGGRLIDYLARVGAITETQAQSAYGRNGRLTEEARNDLRKLMLQNIFNGGADNIENAFALLPDAAQKALVQAMAGDMRLDEQDRLLPDVQNAIMAVGELRGKFGEAVDTARKSSKAEVRLEEMRKVTGAATRQIDLISRQPAIKGYSELELELAALILTQNQNSLKAIFAEYQRLVIGTEGDMFNPPEKLTREESIKRVFNVKDTRNEHAEKLAMLLKAEQNVLKNLDEENDTDQEENEESEENEENEENEEQQSR